MAFDFNYPNIVPEYMDFDVAFEPTKVKDKKYVINATCLTMS